MKKLIKKIALLSPSVRNHYRKFEEMQTQIDILSSQFEQQRGKDSYRMQQLNNMFEDNVKHSWAEHSERKNWICAQPFTRINISENGAVFTCCSNYLKLGYFIGNVYTDTFNEIWNSDIAKRLRYSVLCGNFEYCNETYCNALRDPSKNGIMFPRGEKYHPIPDIVPKNWEDCSLKTSPTHIHLTCDKSCNLHCASCRNQVFINSKEINEKKTAMLENFVRPALRDCTLLSSLGNGELFASEPVLRFFKTLSKKEFPQLKLNILTNGTLLNPQQWGELSNLKGMVNGIQVSIDAANKETFEKLRRGGRWGTLCNNMEFVSSLRVSNEIKKFAMSFVVQKENYRQMRDYTLLAKKWNADIVSFRRLKNNGGTYSADDYTDNDVFNKDNPRYQEAVQILSGIIDENDIEISDNCIRMDGSVEE